MTDNTTLEDLLALQLHLLEDEVRNIVDKAVKEMAIEKVLLHLKQNTSTLRVILRMKKVMTLNKEPTSYRNQLLLSVFFQIILCID